MKILKISISICVVLALVIFALPLINSPDYLDYDEVVQEHMQGNYITINGKKVHYLEKGVGQTVILIHGFLYNSVMWEKNIDALANKYHVLAVDLWGGGYSERLDSSRYSFKTYSEQIIGLMDALNIERASLIGQSLGGGISVYTAAHYPKRIDRLILVDPAVIPYKLSATAKLYKLPFVGEFLNAIPGDSMLENNVRTLWFYDGEKVSNEYLKRVIAPLRIKGTFSGAMHVLREVLTPPYVEKEANMLANMFKPILIVHGREDGEVPLESSEKLHELWKNSQLEIFDKARHSPHEEYPDKFNKMALKFLDQ